MRPTDNYAIDPLQTHLDFNADDDEKWDFAYLHVFSLPKFT